MPFVRTLTFNLLFVLTTATLSLAAAPGLLMPYSAVIWFKQIWLRLVLGLTRLVIGIDEEGVAVERIRVMISVGLPVGQGILNGVVPESDVGVGIGAGRKEVKVAGETGLTVAGDGDGKTRFHTEDIVVEPGVLGA